MKLVLGYIVLGFMYLAIQGVPRAPGPETATVDPVVAGNLLDPKERTAEDIANEDIDEPVLSWAEAHCAPRGYRPPEALVPDRWHPANSLLNVKP